MAEVAMITAATVNLDGVAALAPGLAEQALAPARLLTYKLDHWVALPVHTTMEVLDRPPTINVPGAAYYCKRLVRWQEQWLPLLDLETLLQAYDSGAAGATARRYVLVVAYQTAPGQPLKHGALSLPALPQTVGVSDLASCELPTDSDMWPLLALSCFGHAGQRVPILDTARLFGAYLG